MLSQDDEEKINFFTEQQKRLEQNPNDEEARQFVGRTYYLMGNYISKLFYTTKNHFCMVDATKHWDKASELLFDHPNEILIMLYRRALIFELDDAERKSFPYFEKAMKAHLESKNLDTFIISDSESLFALDDDKSQNGNNAVEVSKKSDPDKTVVKLFLNWCRSILNDSTRADAEKLFERGLKYWSLYLRDQVPQVDPKNLEMYSKISILMMREGQVNHAFDIMNRHLHLIEYIDPKSFDQSLYMHWVNFYKDALKTCGYSDRRFGRRLIYMHYGNNFKNPKKMIKAAREIEMETTHKQDDTIPLLMKKPEPLLIHD